MGRFETWDEYKESIINQCMRLEAKGENWNVFYCGERGCPYHNKKCDPDHCGHYHHYKNGDYWTIEDGKIFFFDGRD
jgi:hypothetical protein